VLHLCLAPSRLSAAAAAAGQMRVSVLAALAGQVVVAQEMEIMLEGQLHQARAMLAGLVWTMAQLMPVAVVVEQALLAAMLLELLLREMVVTEQLQVFLVHR
jgi:hypothetical protein